MRLCAICPRSCLLKFKRCRNKNPNFQTPNPKQTPMAKFQIAQSATPHNLGIEVWNFFGIWALVIGIFSPP